MCICLGCIYSRCYLKSRPAGSASVRRWNDVVRLISQERILDQTRSYGRELCQWSYGGPPLLLWLVYKMLSLVTMANFYVPLRYLILHIDFFLLPRLASQNSHSESKSNRVVHWALGTRDGWVLGNLGGFCVSESFSPVCQMRAVVSDHCIFRVLYFLPQTLNTCSRHLEENVFISTCDNLSCHTVI